MQNERTKARQAITRNSSTIFKFLCIQNGVHIKDRGNTALPTDIVKVLKTQDENYIRTMRTAGLKVGPFLVCVIQPSLNYFSEN
jgi:U3 small nucleolar RNA-associated protein 11